MHDYHIAARYNVALLQFQGTVRGPDVIATTQAFHADDEWDPGMDVIWDCRRVRSLDLVAPDLMTLVDLRTSDTVGRDVSVVLRDLDRSIAELYKLVAERRGKDAFVCRTIADALRILGLDERVRDELPL